MLTEKTEALRAKVEPLDAEGITVYGGAIRTADGLVIPSTDDRRDNQNATQKEEPKRKPVQKEAIAPITVQPREQPPVQVTYSFDINGAPFVVPAFYKSVHVGSGCVVLTMNDMSYTPQVYKQGDPLFTISASPDKKYAYTGMAFDSDGGSKSIILIEG